MKTGWLVLVSIVVVVAALVAWRSSQPDAYVTLTSPTVGTMQAWVEEQAVTELPHDHLVSMPISGWLQPITLREGDRVKAGQVVARLDADDLRDRVAQVEQQIATLESQIAEATDHRLEENALVEVQATVKAIDETVAAAEAQLDATRAIHEFAASEFRRLEDLSEQSAAAQTELRKAAMEARRTRADFESDRLELAALKTLAAVSYIGPKFITDYIDRKSFTLAQRQAELAERKAQLQIEQRNLGRAEIAAPVDGVVLTRQQTRRQYLAAGTPLLTIGQLDELEVIAEVLTERAPRIAAGDRVEISGQAIEAGAIAGRVLRVYPAGFEKVSSLGVEQQRVNVAIAIDDRPEGLGVGFRVYVRIIYAERADALLLARTALFRTPNGAWAVLLVRDGVVEQQGVEVGLLNDDHAEIVSGLTETDRVVAHPSREIEVGMRVAEEAN